MEGNTSESWHVATSEHPGDCSDGSATDTADEGDFEDALEDLTENERVTETHSETRPVEAEMDQEYEKLKHDIEHGLDLNDLNTNVQSNIDSAKPEWVKSSGDEDSADKDTNNAEDGKSHLLASRLNAELPPEDSGSDSDPEAEKEVVEDEEYVKQQEALLSEEELQVKLLCSLWPSDAIW